MDEELADFDRWLELVFVPEERMQWMARGGSIGLELGYTEDRPDYHPTSCRYMTKAFEEATTALGRFTDDDLANGLNNILIGPFTDVLKLFPDEVDIFERIRLLRSTVPLFTQELFPRSQRMTLLDPERAMRCELDACVFMFWEAWRVERDEAYPGLEEVHEVGLECLERILYLPSASMQHSALHGLNHAAQSYPEKAVAIIDRWLATNPTITPKQREYAQHARTGKLL